MSELQLKGKQAKEASYFLGNVTSEQKQQALYKMAAALLDQQEAILKANKLDVEKAVQKGTSKAMLDRLSLNEERIHGMADGLRQVAALADPVGEVLSMAKRPNGLQIGQQRVPIGVIGIIYEARPNVTCDATGLCLKAGNAVILRGGSEAFYSNQAIVSVLSQAAASAGLPEHSVQLIENTSRETALELMKLNEYIDVLIPRGGAGLIEAVVKNATVPVIETGTGNCHIYVDEEYDGDMAANIVINAKTSRPAVCNSAEKLIIHKRAAHEFLPIIVQALREKDVEVRGDERAVTIVPDLVPAGDEDWKKEYLDFIMAVKIVDDIDEAISHINVHSSHHSEAIVTTNYAHAQRFLQRVNSAAVYVNASTRFTDGEEFGFGAEIGISTQKLHARGPMGLKELTTLKYIIYGDGQIR
ncbi:MULTISPECIES: glutamate-5-semialdehyde dehydrogenase [Priestia]|jgi:glutamate-5-semialdehyde dehydrogenase|uniref:Gamma-glutamyl phosphate reductase n=2 Tax=Priestia megaterium TaxID=1404 RepID=A0A6M6DJJ8_PRIMG|nr:MULTISPECIES: glutamate-5-semialdehyde dehydrogenase [Priestia]ADF42022.1 gamma-glutamyl phosphate reductase [Priestia megaterium DSM 319]AYE48527.1 glutamate-5-semialdehyde dehydrogenase [Priestia megaterium NCT-2]MBU8755483.1 glutamate-5-semialdehyde dehydrogenase [Priestia megaterium]MDC0704451.1 glutamate-5-semialdehyde dehydrogenase [Priestia sp. AB]MDM8152374.1 glutamate-5-semialdehyde dehydrogenase [Priestia megaterium]